MKCEEWQEFLIIPEHGWTDLDNAHLNAGSWASCAIGCRLQKYFGKTEEELKEITNNVYYNLDDLLSSEARELGMDFMFLLDDDDDTNYDVSISQLKEVFDKIQALPTKELFREGSEKLRVPYYKKSGE